SGMQTRVFQVNYLPGQRRGQSDTRVTSGAVTDIGSAGAPPGIAPVAGAPQGSSRALETSRVTTQQQSDFWGDLRIALVAIVGAGDGRSVIVTAQSGVVVVRALPQELRAVEQYLRATRLSMERQVMLEAKIIDVTLSDEYQAGINWALFSSRLAVGQLSTNSGTATALGARGQVLGTGPGRVGLVADPSNRNIATTTGAFAPANAAGAVFG